MIELLLALQLIQAKAPPAPRCITVEQSEQQLRSNGLPTIARTLRGPEAQALVDRLAQRYAQPHVDADEVRLYSAEGMVIVMVYHQGCRVAGGVVQASDLEGQSL